MSNEKYKKIQNGPKNSIPKNFIPNEQNPDNGSFYGERNNPLCSKGNSVMQEDYDVFQPGSTETSNKQKTE